MELHNLSHKLGIFEKEIKGRNFRETAVGVIFLLFLAPYAASRIRDAQWIQGLGALLLVLGIAFIICYLSKQGSLTKKVGLSQTDLSSYLTYWKHCYQRQIKLLKTVLWWYLLPLVPGPILIVGGIARGLGQEGLWIVFVFGVTVIIVFGLVMWLNRREVRKLQKELAEIEEWQTSRGTADFKAPQERQGDNLKQSFGSGSILTMAIALLAVVFAIFWVVGGSSPAQADVKAVSTCEELVALAKECPAEVGFYGKNFPTGEAVEYQPDQPACLASIVKIFVLVEVMRQAELRALDLSESITIKREDKEEICTVSEAVDKMIGASDNEATGALAARVGFDRVNALGGELGIAGLSEKILPEPGILGKVLDKRVFGRIRICSTDTLLPQHGTARAIVKFFELLHEKKLVNSKVSEGVLAVFDKNPKPFAPARPVEFYSGGKGGSITWVRPFFPEYNMVGWGLYLHSPSEAAAFCVWFEWFPRKMNDSDRQQWMDAISNSIVQVLLGDTASGVTVAAIPSFASAIAVVEKQQGLDAWEKLTQGLNTEEFAKLVESGRVGQPALFAAEIIPMVVCQNVPTKAHFTWRWQRPDGVYNGTEIEFAPGRLWGWLPVVKLDREGSWHFEIACNGSKILDQRIRVDRETK